MQGVARIPEPREWLLKKTCTRCGETKPWARFPPYAYFEDGRVRAIQPSCHACNAAALRVTKQPSQTHRNEYKLEWSRRRRTATSRRLPVGPTREFLLANMEDGLTLREMSELCDLSERCLYRLIHEQERVSLRVADTIATRLGAHLYDLYPEMLEMVA